MLFWLSLSNCTDLRALRSDLREKNFGTMPMEENNHPSPGVTSRSASSFKRNGTSTKSPRFLWPEFNLDARWESVHACRRMLKLLQGRWWALFNHEHRHCNLIVSTVWPPPLFRYRETRRWFMNMYAKAFAKFYRGKTLENYLLTSWYNCVNDGDYRSSR